MNTDAHSFLLAIATCIVETPPPSPYSATKKPAKKKRGKKTTKISHQKLQKALVWSSRGAANRALENGKKTRKRLREGDKSALDTRKKRKKGTKYSEEELLALCKWMLNNMYTRDSSMKVDDVKERDLYGKLAQSILRTKFVITHFSDTTPF